MTKKVVIIDDSATQLNLLKSFFIDNGWMVCGVQSARIGYEVIFNFAPDLIITDALMPVMGGFQLIKLIRQNELISKIPVIVYSVLNENNAKFYIHENLSEYFLKKEDNLDELLELAQKTVSTYPLGDDYKQNILDNGFKNIEAVQINEKEENKLEEIKEEKLEEEKELSLLDFEEFVKNKINYLGEDEKNFSEIFKYLHNFLNYELAMFCVEIPDRDDRWIYFDIHKIILSPILRYEFFTKFGTINKTLYKKYAPNLVTINKLEDFESQIEFEIENRSKVVSYVAFYSRVENQFDDEEKNNKIKEILDLFFKTRYIKKGVEIAKKENKEQNYFNNNSFKYTKETYFATVQITNYQEIEQDLQVSDIVNSKISEKIIATLEKDEKIYKNEDEEYCIIFNAKDDKQAKYRLDYILDSLENISYDSYKVNAQIYASSCYICDTVNIDEAKRRVRELIDETNSQEKVVIYDERK